MSVPSYEYHCYLSGGAYNDTVCGWFLMQTVTYIICFDWGQPNNGGGSAWPPSPPGGASPSPPSSNASNPCPGDVLVNTKIAPSNKYGNVQGGRFGLTRTDQRTKLPKQHNGLDLYAPVGTPVYAAYSGTVIKRIGDLPSNFKKENSFGNQVVIKSTLSDGSEVTILYGHLSSLSEQVFQNMPVTQGQFLGLSGRTGNAQNVPYPHVHIEVRKNGHPVNPEPFLSTKFDLRGIPFSNPCN